jgi:nucleoside diphosphate kinase
MLSRMAQEFQLFPIYKESFRNFYNEHRQQPAYRNLMDYMNVVDADGHFLMDEEQLEAASTFFNRF